eukprot:m.15999 g.15999  ORF g.15999 m.15999 type:complete len:100 (-) comp8889_c0_seq1:1024-1323(-)
MQRDKDTILIQITFTFIVQSSWQPTNQPMQEPRFHLPLPWTPSAPSAPSAIDGTIWLHVFEHSQNPKKNNWCHLCIGGRPRVWVSLGKSRLVFEDEVEQ